MLKTFIGDVVHGAAAHRSLAAGDTYLRLLWPVLVRQSFQDAQQHGSLSNARFPEEIEVQLVETLMGEPISEPDGGRKGGCTLGHGGHLRVVLQGTAYAHPAEGNGQGTVSDRPPP